MTMTEVLCSSEFAFFGHRCVVKPYPYSFEERYYPINVDVA